jgi:hypothetical protein
MFQRGSFTVSVFKTSFALILTAAVLSPSAFASRVHRAPTSGQTRASHKLNSRKAHKVRGQQAIDPERVTQIQQALIHEHYLTGEATGKWDASTTAAMQKFQGDQGWQTKLTPDSRALAKLGLGPDYSSAINAKDSSFATAAPANTIPQEQASGFVAGSGVNQ